VGSEEKRGERRTEKKGREGWERRQPFPTEAVDWPVATAAMVREVPRWSEK
jgi:hypothetical protein